MARRRSKHTKHTDKGAAHVATILTPQQKRWVKEATSSCTITIDEKKAISPVLLDAIKRISKITKLAIEVEENICCEVVQCIADIMSMIPSIATISFSSRHRYANYKGVKSAVGASHYKMLTEAIASASCLQLIYVEQRLPWEMEAAIIEGLKKKTTFTTLELVYTSFIMDNAAIFGELLTIGKGLGCLKLQYSECHDIEGKQLQNGLQKCESLKRVVIYQFGIETEIDNTIKCLLEGLGGNQSLETFELLGNQKIGSSGVSLLNQLISNHEKLKLLRIHKDVFADPEGFEAFCNSVSCSRSMAKLCIGPNIDDSNNQLFSRHIHTLVSAVNRMLQQTTSLQYLDLPSFFYNKGMDEIVVGIMACKTLRRLDYQDCFDLNTTLSLLDAVISNPNIIKINDLGNEYVISKDGCNNECDEEMNGDESDDYSDGDGDICGDDSVDTNDEMRSAQMELQFYVALNRKGRSLVRTGIPHGVWPHALEKAGRSLNPDALYFFIRECPQLTMNHTVG